MTPEDKVITVIANRKSVNLPHIQRMRANGAEVWSDVMMRASQSGIKRMYPDSTFKDMRDLYGKFKGETVFICGSGPSLSTCPPKLPGPTFAINRAIKHVQADYWCFSDVKATRDSGSHENAKAATWAFGAALHVFFPTVSAYLIEAAGDPLGYKEEARRPIYWNGATFSWVLSWAIKTGAKQIVVIGCEFSLDGYFDGTAVLPTTQMASLIVSQTARLRVDDMFGPDKHQWFDPAIEMLDASKDGYLPIPKTRLEDWL